MLGAAVTAFLTVVAVFVGGCGGEQASNSSVEDQDKAEQQKAESEKQQPTTSSTEGSTASVGETLTLGNVQWTVTDVQQSDILVSRFGTEEGNFVIVDLTFSNNSNQDITLATPFITLVDSEGREIEADVENNFKHVYPEENMFVDHVTPGDTKEGRILFSMDPDTDTSGLKLQVGEARFASGETAQIDLGTPRSAIDA
jgi:hypothetical protein